MGLNAVARLEGVAIHTGSANTFVMVIAIAAPQNVAVAVSTNATGDGAAKTLGNVLKDLLTRFAQ